MRRQSPVGCWSEKAAATVGRQSRCHQLSMSVPEQTTTGAPSMRFRNRSVNRRHQRRIQCLNCYGRDQWGWTLPPSDLLPLVDYSGVVRNFRQGVRRSVAFLPIHPCSAAVPSRPFNQKTSWCMNSCTHRGSTGPAEYFPEQLTSLYGRQWLFAVKCHITVV